MRSLLFTYVDPYGMSCEKCKIDTPKSGFAVLVQ